MLKAAILSAALVLAVSPAARAQNADRVAVEAFYTQVINGAGSADLAQRAERVLAPNWESVGDYSGRNKTRAEFVAQMGGFASVLPDMRWEIIEILQQGNRYVVRGRAQATPVRPFFGVEPAGKRFDIMSIDIHTVENGRIVRSYHIEDWATALRQLRAQ
ncbi:MAG: ester cyclase [Tagaea sp.]|nr:ester cyclase [Tagaea sp.]